MNLQTNYLSLLKDIKIKNDLKLKTPEGKLYIPNHEQSIFHAAMKRERLFSGGVGSGKTLAGCMEGLKLSLMFPNNRGLIGRLTYRELTDTTQRVFEEILPPQLIYDTRKQDNVIILKNGSEIMFRSFDKPFKLRSLNLGWIYMDEITELGWEFYDELKRRLRWSGVPARFIFGTTNADAPVHWAYRYFYEYKKPKFNTDGVPLTQKAIKNIMTINASTLSNKENLPDDYLDDLLEMDEESKARWVEAKWILLEGLIYPLLPMEHLFYSWTDGMTEYTSFGALLWRKNKDLMQNDLSNRRVIIGVDKGWENPSAVEFIVEVEWNGIAYYIHFDEIYETRLDNEQLAKKVIYKLKEYGIINYEIYIDPAAAETKAKFISNGLKTKSAENSVDDGIEYVRNLYNKNRIFIMRDRCSNLVSELMNYKYKTVNGISTEKPIKTNDHACDAQRYGLYTNRKNRIQFY